MIYDYLKEQLKPLEEFPETYRNMLRIADLEVDKLHEEFDRKWTHCCGCKGYVKRADAYEEIVDSKEAFSHKSIKRTVLKCGKCHSIWKFLD